MNYIPPPNNPLCLCRKSGAWLDRYAALDALDKIVENPRTERVPVAVHPCDEGVFHLTYTPNASPRRKR